MDRLPFANTLPSVLSMVPPADRTGISELNISDLRAWTIAKADEHHRYTLAFNNIQNLLAPIHRLPSEILSRIFVQAWNDRRSLCLAHVCTLWRTLLLDTSEFWAVAIAGDEFRLPSGNSEVSDEDYLGAASLRSAPRAISIHLSSVSPKSRSWLIEHAHRIASIRVSVHTHDRLDSLWKVLQAGMPRLEDLIVRVHEDVSDSVPKWAGPTQISTDALPLLTRMTIPAFLFRGVWPNTLQAIALRSDSIHSVVTLDTVLASLEDYPSLTVLDVRDKTLIHAIRSSPPSRTFPVLELLRIRSEWSVASMILSHLRFPPSTCVQIRIVRGMRRASGEPFVPLAGAALDAAVAHIDHVTIYSGPTSTIRGLADGAACLRVTADWQDWSSSRLEWTLRIFERTSTPVSRLLLSQHTAQPMDEAFMGRVVFSAFSRLTHLTLHGRSGVCAALLRVLSPPSHGVTEPALLVPLLKELTVGIATKRRSEISKSLRREDLTQTQLERWPGRSVFVSVHFKECCRLFPGVLGARSQRGCRLSRLEFFSFEEGCMAMADSVVSHVDLAALMPGFVDHAIWPLRRFVDGPVVFSGYRFFTDA